MKFIIPVSLPCFIAMLLFLCPTSSVAAPFYVSTQGDDAWSGTLPDPNDAKTDGPFATLERARDAVRAFRKTEPEAEQAPVVLIRGGTYYLDQTFELGPEDSGTEKIPTYFTSFSPPVEEGCSQGEKVVLSGGRPLTGWKETAPGRWTTTVPEVAAGEWYFEQLYVNDQRRFRPTLPKDGYFTVAKKISMPEEKQAPDRFGYGEAPFRADWKNLDDIEVQTFHLWTMDHLRVKAVDEAKRQVVFAGPTHSWDQARLERGTPYRIVNVYEALTAPGQWYLDRKTGELTYLALPGEDMNTAVVVAPKLERIVSVTGDLESDRFVEHVAFSGLTFAHTAWNMPEKGMGFPQAAVYLDGALTYRAARHCSLISCGVRHTGNYAIDFGDGCHDCGMIFCELVDLGGGGVKIGPTQLGHDSEAKWCKKIVLLNNYIAHGGRLHPEAVGIWIGHAGENMIAANEVYDFYYSAISVGWNWSSSYSPAHHNRIYHNHLHKLGQGVLNDLAGIYTLGKSPGTVLEKNVIYDVSRMNYGGWGIYFDESSEGIVAEHNLVGFTQDAGLHQHYGRDNIVRENVFASAENGLIRLSNREKSGKITFEDNIFVFSTPPLAEEGLFYDAAEMKGNVYLPADNAVTPLFPGNQSFDAWKEQREPDALLMPASKGMPTEPLEVLRHLREYQRILKADVPEFTLPDLEFCRTKNLPPVPAAFSATPKLDEMLTNFSIDEDFENEDVGRSDLGLFQVEAHGECSVRVSDDTGAGGSRRSLKFVEGAEARNSWEPHVFFRTKYRDGTIRISFDLRVDERSHVIFEARDWPGFRPGYKTGPQLEFRPGGEVFSHGEKVWTVKPGEWFGVELSLSLSCEAAGDIERKDTEFNLTFTMQGEKAGDLTWTRGTTLTRDYPQKLDGIDWIGFSSHGPEGSAFYLDNIKIERTAAE